MTLKDYFKEFEDEVVGIEEESKNDIEAIRQYGHAD
jgi:low affinity Fe/Cu permease